MKLDTVLLERVARAAVDEGLADVVYATQESPIGDLLVAVSPKGLCRVAFGDEEHSEVLAELAGGIGPRVLASQDVTADIREALAAYFEGDPVDFETAIDFALIESPFQRKVLTALQRVGRGHVTTYGALASKIGHPKAARATGTALGRNPVPIIVPCHRVIQSSGAIGGYGGSPWRKEFLLRLEGALGEDPGPGAG